jgi:hypothetical protein
VSRRAEDAAGVGAVVRGVAAVSHTRPPVAADTAFHGISIALLRAVLHTAAGPAIVVRGTTPTQRFTTRLTFSLTRGSPRSAQAVLPRMVLFCAA